MTTRDMKKSKWLLSAGIIIAIILPLTFIYLQANNPVSPTNTINPTNPAFQKGMTYAPFEPDIFLDDSEYQNIDSMLDLGVEWISLVPIWYQEGFA